jgi:hypothetical protein
MVHKTLRHDFLVHLTTFPDVGKVGITLPVLRDEEAKERDTE